MADSQHKGEAWRRRKQVELSLLYRQFDNEEEIRKLYAEIWADAKLEARKGRLMAERNTEREQKALRLYMEDVNVEERQGASGWHGLPKHVRDAYLAQVDEKEKV